MISTHILDTAIGQPAPGVTVELEKEQNGNWQAIAKEKTNSDGRISFACPAAAGTYRLQFHTGPYTKTFFPVVPVIFEITDTARKYHIPLLLSPFGYSTYRGS